MDVRLLSGEISRGCLVRRQISKDSYTSWLVTDAQLRSPDLAEEYHLTLAVEREEAFEVFEFQMSMLKFDESVWQVARPRSTTGERTA